VVTVATSTQTAPAGKRSSETDTRGQGEAKRENVFTRKIGPLPMWVWVAIIGAAVVLYALWKGHSSASSPSSGTGTKTGSALVPPEVAQGQDAQDDDDDGDRRRHRRRKRGGVDPGGPEKGRKGGPERRWLEKKTGSKHPWTYLVKHHERIEVGDVGGKAGSRIVHGSDPRHHRHRRDHEEATENTATATRAVPGQASGPNSGPAGTLVSFTVPQSGPAPSLSQVASQYNTAPDAIVEEATGRGSPHGAEWRRYVANHDWEVPLPHGTDMTILSQPA
jgi:hypothetical protein